MQGRTAFGAMGKRYIWNQGDLRQWRRLPNRRPQEGHGYTEEHRLPKCSKPTRIVKRVKDRERGVPGGVYISCSACDFFENSRFSEITVRNPQVL